jgi:hypothetical protein
MPRGRSLYGSLPEQLTKTTSFVWRLRDILAVRRRYGIATSTQVDIPAVSNRALLVMVHRLDNGLIQATALNFSNHPISDRVISEHLSPGAAVIDMLTDRRPGTVDQGRTFPISLKPHQGMSLLIIPDMTAADRPATAVVSEHINLS